VNPEEIDLKVLQMTHYAVKDKGKLDGVGEGAGVLRPATGVGTGEGRDGERAFLSELIEKLNASRSTVHWALSCVEMY